MDGTTGKFTSGQPTKNATKIADMLRLNNLAAMNTFFQPKANKPAHTFLHTKRNDDADDAGMYVGREVKERYRGRWESGKVVAMKWTLGEPKWVVQYSDGYVATYGERQIKKKLVHVETEKQGHQIDYICVSRRWMSCVQSCTTKWAPSMHRDLHGEKNDHALVESKWKWRIRSPQPVLSKDFNVLLQHSLDDAGNRLHNRYLQDFSQTVSQKATELIDLQHGQALDATTMHAIMCAAIGHAVNVVLPDIKRTKGVKRAVSEATKTLYERRGNMQGSTQAQYDEINKEIRESGLNDFRGWVKDHSAQMQAANECGDTRAIYKSVRVLAGKRQKPSANLTTDGMGNILGSAQDVAKRWAQFLTRKFAATQAEEDRPAMQGLEPTVGQGELTRKEILQGLGRMSNGKATGPDELPIEIFKVCPVCQQLLIELLQSIWRDEVVPTDFAKAKFVMLYKNKGSSDDPSKYRCLGLLNHSYKTLSQCMQARLESETIGFLPDWQAGFRKLRGCRDNVFILRTVIDHMIDKQHPLYLTFIDYSAAFDSVSHKFLDKALAAAGAKDKTRAMFRAIYGAATAITEVQGIDGETIKSDAFPINRGVVQGDITSPLYFILALELILRTHDAQPGKGIELLGKNISTLGYADDAALLDTDINVATARVTAIARGSKADADMAINIDKTEVMHVGKQDAVTATTEDEARKVCKFQCRHAGCTRVFNNIHGKKCHEGKCKWRSVHYNDSFYMDKILAVRGCTGSPGRRFLVRWQDYGPAEDTWEPRSHLHPDEINLFLKHNDLYDYQWPGARCPHCDKPCKSQHGVKMHARRCHYKPDPQKFAGTCADKK